MIIEGLLTLIKNLLTLLFTPIDIPDLPASFQTIINQAIVYITDGLGLVASLTHWDFIKSLVVASLVIWGVMLLYKFIMWILKKIPMASVS